MNGYQRKGKDAIIMTIVVIIIIAIFFAIKKALHL
jgi:hypothetical protein